MSGTEPRSEAMTMIGLPTRPRAFAEPPPQIEDYRFIKPIGCGAFGTVWLAEETTAGVFRAIKVLHAGAAEGDKQAAVQRMERELEGIHAYQVLAKDHPHLVRILKSGMCKVEEVVAGDEPAHAAGEPGRPRQCEPGRPLPPPEVDATCPAPRLHRAVYYVMEIADHAGGAQPHHAIDYQPLTLAALLRQRGRLPCSEVVQYAGELLDAIDHLHKAGLYHRDVKPANCLFIGGVLKLADMGLTASDNGERIGTPGYLPPEGKPDDLYALGKVMYELTTGLPVGGFPEWPGDLDPTADSLLPQLRSIINDLCHPTSERRLRKTTIVHRRLEALIDETGLARQDRRRTTMLVCATLVVGLAAGGFGVKWWFDQRDPSNWVRGRAPYNGAKPTQELNISPETFRLTRNHRPGERYLVGQQNQTIATFVDVQTLFRDGQLIASGAYQIHNIENPCTGDATLVDGEIDQIWLIVGDGSDALMYHFFDAEPGAPPGIRARFRTGFPLSDFGIAYPRDVEIPVYLGFSKCQNTKVAEDRWRHQNGVSFWTVAIGHLLHFEQPPPASGLDPSAPH